MNILAIETSSSAGHIALSCGGEIYERKASKVSHSQSILEMIQQLLDQAELSVCDINCIAVSRGPGSFTGLRIGIAVAQGLAFSHNIPLVSLSSLLVLAATVRESVTNWQNKPNWVLATIDARMQQIYAGWYAIDDTIPKLYAEEQVLSPKNIEALGWPPQIKAQAKNDAGRAIIAGGASVYRDRLPSAINDLWSPQMQDQLEPSAIALLHGAAEFYAAGKTISATELEPAYIRNNVTS